MTSGPNSLSHLGSRANWSSSERIKGKVGGEEGKEREGIGGEGERGRGDFYTGEF